MKNLTLLLSIILLSSCSTYYYSTLDSTNLKKTEDNRFVFENDTLKLSYNFNGEDAPIEITIFNKLSTPLYVDWQRSAVIINDIPISYQKYPFFEGIGNQQTNYYRKQSLMPNKRIENESLPKGLNFIPPKTEIQQTFLKITNYPFENISETSYNKERFYLENTKGVEIKTKKFEKTTSPLTFKSYVSLYTSSNISEAKQVLVENEFYISDLIKSNKLRPKKMMKQNSQRADFFFVKKLNKQKDISGPTAISIYK